MPVQTWRVVVAGGCFAAAAALTVVFIDPWGLFLGFFAYVILALAIGLAGLGARLLWPRSGHGAGPTDP